MAKKNTKLVDYQRKARKIGRIALVYFLLALALLGLGVYLLLNPELITKEVRKEDIWFNLGEIPAGDGSAKAKSVALYNRGTMLALKAFDESLPIDERIKAAKEAIKSLEEAINQDPDNEEAKHNLEVVKKKHEELLQKQLQEKEADEKIGPSDRSPQSEDRGY